MNGNAIFKIVIFLVHGTWDQDAEWTKDNSDLVEGIRKRLAPLSVDFQRFPWSGGNTHGQRLQASDRLHADLETSLESNPNIPHFVIAHSHGGNVACYAMQDEKLFSAISGTLCLGTPFLLVQKSRLPKTLYAISLMSMLIFSAIAVFYIFRPPEDPVTVWFAITTAVLTIPFVGLLLLVMWRARGERFGLKSLLEARRNPNSYVDALALPELPSQKFVAIRISGDEAAGALVVSQLFTWLFRRLWGRLSRIWEFFGRLREPVQVTLGFVLLAAIVAAGLGVISNNIYDKVGGMVILVSGLGGLFGLVVGFVAYCTLALMLVMHIPFGADAMLVSFFAQTTAEPTPTGFTNVYHVTPDDNQTNNKAPLRHSEIYNHPEVIIFIGNWIDESLTNNSDQKDRLVQQ